MGPRAAPERGRMSITAHDRRQEILALESSLLSWAGALTRDPHEARVLVDETLSVAGDPDQVPGNDESTRVWLHRLLRRRFHSVVRDRNFRRSRSNPISAVGYARARVQLAEVVGATGDAG